MEEWDVEQQIPVSTSPPHPAVEPGLAEHGLGLVLRSRRCQRQCSGSVLQGKASASGWASAEEGSWLSQLPHVQFKEIMKRRKRQQEKLGPGTYSIRDFLQETRPSSLRGICETREPRFREARRDCVPGPGTYSPWGNPYARLEERDRRSTSTRGLMDSGTARFALPAAMGSSVGPGTYHLRSSIDELLRRAGGPGSRQPFWGSRSKPAGGGRRALERRGTELSTGTVRGFVDELTLKENKKKGCFSTLPRNPGCPTERIFWATLSQCPREADAVGPGSYNPKPIEGPTYSSQPPFRSSAKRFDRKFYRLFTGNEMKEVKDEDSFLIAEELDRLPFRGEAVAGQPFATASSGRLNPVGVGRYDITRHEKYPQQLRYQSLYQCDAQRYLSDLTRDVLLLERLKPVAKNNWSDLISAPCCPDTAEKITAVLQT
ncbi:ciliary microtubule-associated protein 2 [Nyctibius grandis]|uniref:ciliary microtubule-associated protein 2 n=1 Tax=Nyctibius grandis TaxID=48427 RepID=UPI0035BC396C